MCAALKIGIVGAGNMGRIHARILNDLNLLVGIADSAFYIAKKTADTYNVPAFDNFHGLVEETSPDALIIATPTFNLFLSLNIFSNPLGNLILLSLKRYTLFFVESCNNETLFDLPFLKEGLVSVSKPNIDSS